MTYQAMARRWRPSTFEDMVGQEHVARTLRNALRRGQVAQAFLFTGTRGVGKTTSARILARMLNCTDSSPDARPCGRCSPCLDIGRGASLDVLEIDAASHNGVDDVRALREQLTYAASFEAGRRVVILDEVHMLSTAAFNALLKILEEPPPHVVFILATTEGHKVPSTILSRVQRFDFRRLSAEQVADRLRQIAVAESLDVDEDALGLLGERADGSMRDGLSLFDQVVAFAQGRIDAVAVRGALGLADEASHLGAADALADGDPLRALAVLRSAMAQGVDPLEWARGFAETLRDLAVVRMRGFEPDLLGISVLRAARLGATAPGRDDGDIARWGRILSSTILEMREARQPRAALEMALLRMARLDCAVDVRALLEGRALPPLRVAALPPTSPDPAMGDSPGIALSSVPGAVDPDLDRIARRLDAVVSTPEPSHRRIRP